MRWEGLAVEGGWGAASESVRESAREEEGREEERERERHTHISG